MKTLLEELVKSTLSKPGGWPNPQDSTGMELASLGRRKTCWEAVGPARTVFTTLQEQIADYIDQTSESLPRPVVWSLYMVGGSRQTARPTVTFISDDACSRKSLRRLIKQSGLLEVHPGFLTMDVDRPPGCAGGVIGLQGGFDGDPSNHSTPDSARRPQVMVQTSPYGLMGAALCLPNRDRNPVATCGGVVCSEGKLFLMSVAHPFEKSWRSTYVNTSMVTDYTFDIDDIDDSDDSDEVLIHPASEEGSGTTSSQTSISADPKEGDHVGSINPIHRRQYTKSYDESGGCPPFSLPPVRAALTQRQSFKQRIGYIKRDQRDIETESKKTDVQADSRGHVEYLRWHEYDFWHPGVTKVGSEGFEGKKRDIRQAEPKQHRRTDYGKRDYGKRDYGKRHDPNLGLITGYKGTDRKRERLAKTNVLGANIESNPPEGSKHDLTVNRIISLFLLSGPTVSSARGNKSALDYCLFELPSELFSDNGPPSFLLGTWPVPREPRSSDVIVCTTSGIVHGRLLATPSFMQSSSAGSQQLWTVMLQSSLQDGMCGSWVLSSLKGELYGHIVSGTPGGQLAYIVPFFEVMDDLKDRLGNHWAPKMSHATSGVRSSALSKVRQSSPWRVQTWLADRTTIGSSLEYIPLIRSKFQAEKTHYEAAFELLRDHIYPNRQESVMSLRFSFAVNGAYHYVARWWWLAGTCINQWLENSYCRQTPLSLAAMGVDEMTVKMILDRDDVAVDSRDRYGQTPLAWAAAHGRYQIGRLLLKYGANVDARDDYGRTPLSRAARAGRSSSVRLLLDSGADINSEDEYGRTPLSRAAEGDDVGTVRLLLLFGVNANSKDARSRTSLAWAARKGNEEMVKILLECGAEPNSRDENGWTPVTNAAVGGWEAVVRLLLDREDAETNPKDKDGRTPLSWAAALGHEAVVKFLLGRKDVEIESRNMLGWTPLMLAAVHGNQAVVKLLLDHGADPNCRLESGRMPLLEASQIGLEEVVKLLLELGAAVNIQDECGRTPLHYAAIDGRKAIVKLLVERGARADMEDLISETPLSLAVRHGQEAIVKLLSEHT